MPTPALLLLIATLVPLVSFVVLVLLGKRMGNPLAGWVGTGAIGASFVLSTMAAISWLGGAPDWGWGKMAISVAIPWIPTGEGVAQTKAGYLDLGLYVDSLTIVMFSMVCLVSLLVHIFSIGYMAEDGRFPRFFTYLSLFGFSMLGLVVGGTLLQLFVFWELVGLCSYLLIGFWYEKKSASNAGMKAFVVNRVGDLGFLIGLGLLFYHFGNVTLPEVWWALDSSRLTEEGIHVAGIGLFTKLALTIMGVGLFCGAIGKSAQFPLHVWLPDAMEGPTPVSALIHAATMVAAGVYLIARIFPILTPDAKLVIAIIGVTTLTMSALIAVVQSDIKKVLAYSTVSQLGYMVLGMGVGSWVGGTFHLITHAFFKSLLFLGSGAVILAAHHRQEMSEYGGLWRKIPITAITFAIAVFAIAGVGYGDWGFSGFYSKDMILAHAGAFAVLAEEHGRSAWYWVLFVLPVAMAYVTAFYMARCWMLTFWGKPRNQEVYEHAHERGIIWAPLAILAVLSVVGGSDSLLNVKGFLNQAVVESVRYVQTVHPEGEFGGFSSMWPSDNPASQGVGEEEAASAAVLAGSQAVHEHGWHLMHRWLVWAPLAGILLGVVVYARGYAVAKVLMRVAPVRVVHRWLYRKMYFDELYMGVLVAITIGLSRLGAAIDRYVIDKLVDLSAYAVRQLSVAARVNDERVVDGVVNGVGAATQGLGAAARMPQTGRIRLYVTLVLGIVAIGIAAVVVVVAVVA